MVSLFIGALEPASSLTLQEASPIAHTVYGLLSIATPRATALKRSAPLNERFAYLPVGRRLCPPPPYGGHFE